MQIVYKQNPTPDEIQIKMNITIKDAALNDLDQINFILRLSKAYWGYDQNFLDLFMRKLGITHDYMNKHVIKLFIINDQLAGFFNFSINDENILELDNFFLHPDYIGKGFGKRLWRACCEDAKQYQKDEFIIWSDPNAESFYLKMGCEKIGVRQSPMTPDRYPPILRFKLISLM